MAAVLTRLVVGQSEKQWRKENAMIFVNEIYGPVRQGEGKSSGKEVMFLRLGGCNLACIWCDTPYTWNWKGSKFAHPDKFDPKVEVHKYDVEAVLTELRFKANKMKGSRAVVISGGEPMLQQERLIPLLVELQKDNWWIEVETNGTIGPKAAVAAMVNQFNCSPKLSNSGPDNPISKREVPGALKALAMLPQTTFKFVVTSDEDLDEVLALTSKYDMQNVYLMPEGKTREEQLARQEEVHILCQKFGFHFSPRLHVLEFGNMRAV